MTHPPVVHHHQMKSVVCQHNTSLTVHTQLNDVFVDPTLSLYHSLGDVCRVSCFPSYVRAHGLFFPGKLYILPSTNLLGCGQVANLRVGGIAVGGAGVQERFIEFQHFRPDRVHSTVFTKVASTIVSTSVQQSREVDVSIDIDYQFSSGDVLGFYYPDSVNFIGVYYVTAPVNHPVLTSLVSSPTSNVVTITNPAVMSIPVYMTLSGELSHLVLIYIHCFTSVLLYISQ